jgi:hypothetical protein
MSKQNDTMKVGILLEIADSVSNDRMIVDYDLWSSWVDKRWIMGQEWHGSVYEFGSGDLYVGPRICQCAKCQEHVKKYDPSEGLIQEELN